MKTRNFVLSALGLAAAITFGGAETASAQAKGKSQVRIPVRKEPEKAPEPAKPDTVYIRSKPDTVMMRGRTDTVTIRTRPDTVIQMQMLPVQKLPGVYFGLAGGVAVPMNHWRDFTHDGPDANIQLGWFPGDGAIGLRVDGNWASLAPRKTDCAGCPTTTLISGMADLVWRIPLDRYSHVNPVIYLLGGGGFDHMSGFNNFVNTEGKTVSAGAGGGVGPSGTGSSGSKFDYHAGAGIDYTLGGLHFFNEGRYVVINTDGGPSHYWPILWGLKFY